MFEKITLIRKGLNVDKRSISKGIKGMLWSILWVPAVTYLFLYLYSYGKYPEALGVWQYALYAVLLLWRWHITAIRVWAHTYMIGFTDEALARRGAFCPRCCSPMTREKQNITYDEVVGTEEVTTYYSDGTSSTRYEDITETHGEEVPYLMCANKKCGLKVNPQAEHSSGNVKVMSQLERYPSFGDLPMTFGGVYRLIVGDLRPYRKAMESCRNTSLAIFFPIAILILWGIIRSLKTAWGAVKSVFSVLLGSNELKIAAFLMVGALLLIFSVWELVVWLQCRRISRDPAFKAMMEREREHRTEIRLCRGYAGQAMAKLAPHMSPVPEKRRERKAYEERRQAYVAAVTDTIATLFAEADAETRVAQYFEYHLPMNTSCTAFVDENTGCTTLFTFVPNEAPHAPARAQALADALNGGHVLQAERGYYALLVILPSTSYQFEGMDKSFLEARVREFVRQAEKQYVPLEVR